MYTSSLEVSLCRLRSCISNDIAYDTCNWDFSVTLWIPVNYYHLEYINSVWDWTHSRLYVCRSFWVGDYYCFTEFMYKNDSLCSDLSYQNRCRDLHPYPMESCNFVVFFIYTEPIITLYTTWPTEFSQAKISGTLIFIIPV